MMEKHLPFLRVLAVGCQPLRLQLLEETHKYNVNVFHGKLKLFSHECIKTIAQVGVHFASLLGATQQVMLYMSFAFTAMNTSKTAHLT